MSSDPQTDAREVNDVVRSVMLDVLRRRSAGESLPDEQVIASRPDLADLLRPELAKLQQICAAGNGAEHRSDVLLATADMRAGRTPGMLLIQCPHCREPFQAARDTPVTEIVCSVCGGHFSLANDHAKTAEASSLLSLAHFDLVERLGVGGFGSVWKAHDRKLDRTVAVKIPHRGTLNNEDLEKFLREARAAAQLQHPNIVRVYEVGREGDSAYIVSDFVRGIPLNDWLSGQQPTMRQAAELVAEIADALQHAHDRGVVHRDLKPGNILIDGDGHPHLMDFGLARREAGEVTVTMEGQVLGTPAYMSPEQAQGEAHTADGRSDIYSLGVILFELLTGELPFRGNPRMLMHQVIHDEPPSPRKLNARIPRDLETISLKSLAKSPSRRYFDANALASDLRLWLQRKPITARPISGVERCLRWCRRKPGVAASIGFAVLSLLAGSVVATYFAVAERNARHLAENSAAAAETSAAEAKSLAAEAKAAQFAASEKSEESRKRLVRQYISKGMSLVGWDEAAADVLGGKILSDRRRSADFKDRWGSGDPLQALVWFQKAWETDPDSRNELMHRTRIAFALRHIPELVGICFHDQPVADAKFNASANRVLTRLDGPEAFLWDPRASRLVVPPIRHSSSVTDFAFSKDGEKFFTSSTDGIVRLWNSKTGNAIGEPMVHEKAVRSAAFNPDGSTLATGCDDGVVRFWDTSRAKRRELEIRCSAGIVFVVFSADGRRIISLTKDHIARVWDADAGAPVSKPIAHSPTTAHLLPAISRDASRLLTTDRDISTVTNTTSGKVIWTSASNELPSGAALSPDGNHVLFLHGSTNGSLYEINDGKEVRLNHPRISYSGQFSPDGTQLLTRSSEGRVHVWDVQSGKALFVAELRGDVLSFDGKYLLSITKDRIVRLTELFPTPLEPSELSDLSEIRADKVSPMVSSKGYAQSVHSSGGQWQVHFGGKRGALVSSSNGTSSLSVGNETYSFAKFNQSGSTVLLATDSNAEVWDFQNGSQPKSTIPLQSALYQAEFSNNNERLLAVCENGQAYVYETLTGHRLLGPVAATRFEEYEWRCSISSDGKYVALPVRYSQIDVYDVAEKSKIALREPAIGWNWYTEFSLDGHRFLSGSSDKTARLWDAPTGKAVGPALRHTAFVQTASLAPDGRRVLTAAEGRLLLWDGENGEVLAPPLPYAGGQIWFGRNGSSLFSMNSRQVTSGKVSRWELPTFNVDREHVAPLILLLTGHRIDDTDGITAYDFVDIPQEIEKYRRAWFAWRGIADDPRSQPAAFLRLRRPDIIKSGSEQAAAVTAAEALRRPTETFTLEMVVSLPRLTLSGRELQLLSDSGMCVFLPASSFRQFLKRERIADIAKLKGRTIRAVGKITNHKGSPNIRIDDIGQLKLLPVEND